MRGRWSFNDGSRGKGASQSYDPDRKTAFLPATEIHHAGKTGQHPPSWPLQPSHNQAARLYHFFGTDLPGLAFHPRTRGPVLAGLSPAFLVVHNNATTFFPKSIRPDADMQSVTDAVALRVGVPTPHPEGRTPRLLGGRALGLFTSQIGKAIQMVFSSASSEDERTDDNYYKILQVSSDASPSELRTAYLRLIKLHHPDKLKKQSHHPSSGPQASHSSQPNADHRFAQDLIHAYSILIDPSRRTEYDLKRLQSPAGHNTVSSAGVHAKIVSQVLDLSEFTQLEHEGQNQAGGERFVFPCRCGGQFLISEDQMEADIDTIGCDGCSLTVKVEYQCL
ncbi:hypothetical protein PtA15_5A261 [Puccinia triticina]|uniref:Diphthamide biosynthesis protein 4 n=1 Tax=Puccinia triticina TaxID=208348 RepID=A0ABY7CK12_9BASI|nr:uncharacterized protein PtA15_5A261 [Puccinia triticina]WAQ84688.1 hypothetical protein PtA15_5A261 [Puccinia triticina]